MQGKRAEFFVFGELLKRGIVPYIPAADVGAIDAVVRTSHGSPLTVQIKSTGVSGSKYPTWFQIHELKPDYSFFIICVEAPQGEPGDVWSFPSKVFHAYASSPPKGSPRNLNLDTGKRKVWQPMRAILCGFKNRRELLTDFEKFEELLERPQDLEDVLAMKEALESPKEDMSTLEEYERRREARI